MAWVMQVNGTTGCSYLGSLETAQIYILKAVYEMCSYDVTLLLYYQKFAFTLNLWSVNCC